MTSYKSLLAERDSRNSVIDGVAFSRGLAQSNREFVLERLEELTRDEPEVVKSFVRQYRGAVYPEAGK